MHGGKSVMDIRHEFVPQCWHFVLKTVVLARKLTLLRCLGTLFVCTHSGYKFIYDTACCLQAFIQYELFWFGHLFVDRSEVGT
jgi:hypothetical protein